jgi:hypothetical protein
MIRPDITPLTNVTSGRAFRFGSGLSLGMAREISQELAGLLDFAVQSCLLFSTEDNSALGPSRHDLISQGA